MRVNEMAEAGLVTLEQRSSSSCPRSGFSGKYHSSPLG